MKQILMGGNYLPKLYRIFHSLYRVLKSPEITFLESETAVTLNVGGQLFETTVGILTRDPFSILAALCREISPLSDHESDRLIFIDRDWWIFRHVLSYLRSNVLPTDIETLKELYSEATYYRLELLQKAIEDMPLDHIQRPGDQVR
jgi:hypothetical protein